MILSLEIAEHGGHVVGISLKFSFAPSSISCGLEVGRNRAQMRPESDIRLEAS